MNVLESPGLDTDTASIFLNEAPWIPKDDGLTKPRQAVIMAHRQFFRVLFHQPLSDSNLLSGSLLDSLRHLVSVADAYQSLHVVAVPIDHHMVVHVLPDIAQFYFKKPQELLYLAIRLKCKWLFREVVCRLIGDPTKDAEKIMQMFSIYGTASLIVQKRGLLLHSMNDVIVQILSLTTSDLPEVYKRYSHRVLFIGMAQFKEDMVEHLSGWKESAWSYYALRFHPIDSDRKHLPCPKWYRTTLRSLGLAESQDVEQISKDLDVVYTSLSERAMEKIAPLFVSVVSKPVRKGDNQPTAGDTSNPETEGFTYIDITDSDLPWKLSQ